MIRCEIDGKNDKFKVYANGSVAELGADVGALIYAVYRGLDPESQEQFRRVTKFLMSIDAPFRGHTILMTKQRNKR